MSTTVYCQEIMINNKYVHKFKSDVIISYM